MWRVWIYIDVNIEFIGCLRCICCGWKWCNQFWLLHNHGAVDSSLPPCRWVSFMKRIMSHWPFQRALEMRPDIDTGKRTWAGMDLQEFGESRWKCCFILLRGPDGRIYTEQFYGFFPETSHPKRLRPCSVLCRGHKTQCCAVQWRLRKHEQTGAQQMATWHLRCCHLWSHKMPERFSAEVLNSCADVCPFLGCWNPV